MKTFMTTAVIVAALTLPAFAEGDDPSTKAGEAKGNVKATTDMKQDAGPAATGQGTMRPMTTGTGSAAGSANTNKLTPVESDKSTSGADGGGGGSGGGGGGGGSGGGGGGGSGR
jgi:uncharacterized membrane protein YgcG